MDEETLNQDKGQSCSQRGAIRQELQSCSKFNKGSQEEFAVTDRKSEKVWQPGFNY